MDGLTGTPRQVARLDGFLTAERPVRAQGGPRLRARAPRRARHGAQRSPYSDPRRDYVDIAGIHHLSWTQSAGGVEVFGNGLQANVTKDGRLLSLGGSPISGLRAPAATPAKIASAGRHRGRPG